MNSTRLGDMGEIGKEGNLTERPLEGREGLSEEAREAEGVVEHGCDSSLLAPHGGGLEKVSMPPGMGST